MLVTDSQMDQMRQTVEQLEVATLPDPDDFDEQDEASTTPNSSDD